RRVIQGKQEPVGGAHQWLDGRTGQASGDPVGPLPGGRDCGVARAEVLTQPGRPDPTGDRPPAARQDGPEEEPDQANRGPAVEDGREGGEPRACGRTGREQMHGYSSGAIRLCGDPIVPGRPAAVYRPPNGSRPQPPPTTSCGTTAGPCSCSPRR